MGPRCCQEQNLLAGVGGEPLRLPALLASRMRHSDLGAHTRRFRNPRVRRGKAVFSRPRVSLKRKDCSSVPPRASLEQNEAE
jgi:hypothetical protein